MRRADRRASIAQARRPDPDAVLGVVFHEARLAAGLTCEQAAALSGLSPTRIAGIEDGDGLLIFADAVPLAAAYGRSVKELSDRFEHALASGGRPCA